MTVPKLALHANDIIFKYNSGISATAIAKEYKSTTTTVTNLLKKANAMPVLKRGQSDIHIDRDEALVVKFFNNGMRPSQILAALNGRSKSWLYQVFKRNNLALRGLDNWKPTNEQVEKHAITKQRNAILNNSEKFVYDSLVKAGYSVTPQFAIGRNNIDMVIHSHSIAIEVVCRGTFALYSRNGWFIERIKQCSDIGLHTYIIVATDSTKLISHGIDDMLAWIDFTHRQKAVRRQYRMVRSPFELLATGCSDSNDIATVLSPENIINTAYANNIG